VCAGEEEGLSCVMGVQMRVGVDLLGFLVMCLVQLEGLLSSRTTLSAVVYASVSLPLLLDIRNSEM
jgi:hypothetical protein